MSFLTSQGKFVNLAKESKLFDSLARLADEWPKLTAINDGRSLIDFLRASAGKFTALKPTDIPTALRPALAPALADVQENLGKLTDIIDAFEKSPASKFLSRLDRFNNPEASAGNDVGLISWSGGGTLNGGPAGGKFGFELGASAKLAFDADDRWPSSDDLAADKDLALLLSISASADLKAAATFNVKHPFTVVATANVSASLAPVLKYYFSPDRGQLYGAALARALVNVPAPTALGEIWRAAQGSDFKGLRLSVPGSFTAAFSVAVAAQAELGDISLSAGLGISAKATRTSKLELSIRALPSPSGIRPLLVRLSNKSAAQSQIGVDLSITLDATRLAARAARAVNSALDEVEKELGKLRRFTTPGTLIREAISAEMGKLIDDPALRAALIKDFGLSDDTASVGLIDWASGQLTDAFDAEAAKVRDFLQASAATATSAVVGALGGNLGNALASHEPAIKAAVDRLVDNVRGKFKGEIQTAIASATAPLGAALKRIGVAVADGLNTVNQWFAPVQDFLARIEKIIADVREKTELAAKAKLQVELAWEESRSQSAEFLLEAIITSDGPDVEALFQRLVKGDVDQVVALLTKPEGVAGIRLNRDKSWLALKSSWQDKTSLRLSVLGLELGGSFSLSADTLVAVDGNGNLTLTTKAIASSESKGIKVAQKAAFLAAFQAVAHVGKPAQVAAPQLQIRIKRDYDELRVGGLDKFLQRLETRGLVSKELPERVRSQLTNLVGSGGQQKLPVSVQLSSNATPTGVWRAENWGWRLSSPDQAEATQIELYALVIAAARTTGFLSNEQVAWALDFAGSHTSVKLPEKPNELEIAKVFLAYSRVSNGFEDTPSLGLSESIKSGHYKACLLLGGRPIEGAADIKSKPRGVPGLVSGLQAFYTLGRISRDENRPDLPLLRKQLQASAEQLASGMSYWFSDFALFPNWNRVSERLELLLVVMASILDGDLPKPGTPMAQPLLALTLDPADEFVEPGNAKPIVFV